MYLIITFTSLNNDYLTLTINVPYFYIYLWRFEQSLPWMLWDFLPVTHCLSNTLIHDLQSNFQHNVETNLVTIEKTLNLGENKFWFSINTLITTLVTSLLFLWGGSIGQRASLSTLRNSWKCPKTFFLQSFSKSRN